MDATNNTTDNSGGQSIHNLEYFALILCFVLAGAIAFVFTRRFPQAILTSFFFGMAGAITIYKFLGGFSKEDYYSTKVMRFGGAAGGFVGITLIINGFLQPQIDRWIQAWDLDVNPPNYGDLLVLDPAGNVQKLVVKLKNREDMEVSIEPKKELLEKFVEICWTNAKACAPTFKPVKVSINSNLKPGEGIVCGNQAIISGLPISLRKGPENYVSIYVSNERDSSCDDSNERELRLKISSDDNRLLNRCPAKAEATYNLGPFRKPTKGPLSPESFVC